MIHLLEIEFLKITRIFNLKVILIYLLYSSIVLIFSNYETTGLNEGNSDIIQSSLSFQEVLKNTLFPFSIFFFCLFIIYTLSIEFEGKTVIKNLYDGLKRVDFITTKVIFFILLGFLFELSEAIKYILFAFFLNVKVDYSLFIFLLKSVISSFYIIPLFVVFSILLGVLIKDKILGIVAFIGYRFIEDLLYYLDTKFLNLGIPKVLPFSFLYKTFQIAYLSYLEGIIVIAYLILFMFFIKSIIVKQDFS